MSTSTEFIASSPPTDSGAGTKIAGFFRRERFFLFALGMCLLLASITFQNAGIARWVGFLFAGYAAVANDSIQTIGTFIASNKQRPWWLLWIFIGGIFLFTMVYGWIQYDGDVSYGRLASKGFTETPASFSYLQIAAPLALLVLTRLKMPVSTTLLLLASFSTSTEGVGDILSKSFTGYVAAFGVAIVVFLGISRALERFQARGPAHRGWTVAQWITSGFLWSVWLMQDAANIAVFLPRQLSPVELFAFVGVLFLGLGLLFWQGGERIQQVVDEKSHVVDVRAATIIDLTFGVLLYWFKVVSPIPMSTTWVFIGLLAGREIGMAMTRTGTRSPLGAIKLMGKDLLAVSIGLIVSVLIAISVNETLRHGILSSLGLE